MKISNEKFIIIGEGKNDVLFWYYLIQNKSSLTLGKTIKYFDNSLSSTNNNEGGKLGDFFKLFKDKRTYNDFFFWGNRGKQKMFSEFEKIISFLLNYESIFLKSNPRIYSVKILYIRDQDYMNKNELAQNFKNKLELMINNPKNHSKGKEPELEKIDNNIFIIKRKKSSFSIKILFSITPITTEDFIFNLLTDLEKKELAGIFVLDTSDLHKFISRLYINREKINVQPIWNKILNKASSESFISEIFIFFNL